MDPRVLKLFVIAASLCFVGCVDSEDVLRTIRAVRQHPIDFESQLKQLQDQMINQAALLTKQSEKQAMLETSRIADKDKIDRLIRSMDEYKERTTMLERSRIMDQAKIAKLESAVAKLDHSNSHRETMILRLLKSLKRHPKAESTKKTARHVKNEAMQIISENGKADVTVNRSEPLISDFLNVGKNGHATNVTPMNASSADPVTFSPRRHIVSRSDDDQPLAASLAHVVQQVDNMAAKMAALESSVSDAASSVFTRWGCSSCGIHADTVYSGTIGGSLYKQGGNGANYLCLPPDPILSSHTTAHAAAYLYGTEYETYDNKQNEDALCAVCRSRFPTTLMTPATTACRPGWTKQYVGYLMAESHDHANSEFICVDSSLEAAIRSDQDQNGRLLYFTQTVCGSLPCHPYTNAKVVTCVVCSK